jgi:hypothetical protein
MERNIKQVYRKREYGFLLSDILRAIFFTVNCPDEIASPKMHEKVNRLLA